MVGSEDNSIELDPETLSNYEGKILSLTRNEALFIDDSLSMIIESQPGDERLTTVRPLSHSAGLPAPVDLLEKIGMAVLFTTDLDNEGEEADIPVSDTDLYMLREITHSYIKIGEEPAGYNLKRKVYALLYETYERDKIAKQLIAQVDLPSLDNVPMEEQKVRSPEE